MFPVHMRLQFMLLLMCLLLPRPSAAAQSTPTNDICAGATVIPGAGPFPHLTPLIGDISGASTNGDPPFPSCALSGLTNSLWFKFAPTATALYRVSTCSDTETTVDDTVMAVYRSSTTGCGTLTEVTNACSDDACVLRAAVTKTLTAGSTYFIVVWRFALGESSGGTALQLRISKPVQPTNDICSAATTIPGIGPFPYFTSTTDITLASTNSDPPSPSCQENVSNSVWYKFKPAAAGVYRLSTCAETATTVEDTIIALYSSSAACAGPFTELDCSDDGCGLRSSLAMSLNTNTTYYALVWGYSPGMLLVSSDLQLRVSKVGLPTVLSLTNNVARFTQAALQAAIAPNEGHITAYFEWGTTTNYGQATPPQNLGTATNFVQLTENITGLSVDTRYHIRAIATNEVGVALSPDYVFKTAAPPRFTSYSFLSNGAFRMQFAAPTTETYRVLASSDLLDWIEIGVPDPLGQGLFQFDDDATAEPGKFYRLVSP